MLNVLIFFVFLMIWVLPPYMKQGKERMPAKKWYLFAMLTMAIPGFIVIVATQIALAYGYRAMSAGYVAQCFLEAFVSAAIVEESLKFLTGKMYLKGSKAQRKIDYIFIFAAAGIGYEIIESLAGMSGGGVVGGIIRGVFALHVFWQMYMGAHYYEYRAAKEAGDGRKARKELRKTFLVPVLLHGLNDLGLFFIDPAVSQEAGEMSTQQEAMLAAGMALFVISFVLNIILIIVTLKTVYRAAKDSKAEEDRETAPSDDI